MPHKDKLKEMLSTLFYSWGGDTPKEAVWAGNELLEWIELVLNVKIKERFNEDIDAGNNYDSVIKEIDAL